MTRDNIGFFNSNTLKKGQKEHCHIWLRTETPAQDMMRGICNAPCLAASSIIWPCISGGRRDMGLDPMAERRCVLLGLANVVL